MEREGSSAIVDGTLGTNGTVDANQLMLKCPSRYEQVDQIKVQAIK
jgi:cytochrome c-type biogenesis protein CcmE